MNDETLDSPGAIKSFLVGTSNLKLSVPKAQRYAWIARTLKSTRYLFLSKKEKTTVREYMERATGYSRAQLTRLIEQYRTSRWIGKKVVVRNKFSRQYTRDDILLLANTDVAHQTLSGAVTKRLFERAYEIYHDESYKRLSKISVAHIDNLRKSSTYQCNRRHFIKTQRSAVNIGERRKPQPEGRPGFIRIDTVHQGDQDKQKGVYHINAVDEVTQFEVVASVEKISENYLIPVLEAILETFPFVLINFHCDCGSEYINRHVVKLLNKLHIQLTKSRARHCNDNALAECKNGAIIRKYLGYIHIPQQWASLINEFNKNYLIPYLNFHRPCYFSKVITDKKGKEKKVYPYDNVMTPYEKLKSLDKAEQYLKPEITFKMLDKQAIAMTDFESAKSLCRAQKKLLETIFKKE